MKVVYVGIDLGSTCFCSVQDAEGNYLERVQVPFSGQNLIGYVSRLKEKRKVSVRVHIEESNLSSYVYRILKPETAEVVVSDPKRNAWIARSSQKNDRIDGDKLAELLRLGSYSPVYQPETDEMAEFKLAVQQYIDVRKSVVSTKAQLKAMFRQQGILIQGQQVYDPEGRKEYLEQLASPVLVQLFRRKYRVLDLFQKEREGVKRQVISLGRRHPVVQRLKRVPGVGWLCAAVFVGYIQNPWRFSNKRKLWRYARLGITDRSSDGKPLGRKRLDRSGNGILKAVSRTIFTAATRTKTENLFQRFYKESLERTNDPIHARLNTQRKILTVLWTLWKEEREYSDRPEEQSETQRA